MKQGLFTLTLCLLFVSGVADGEQEQGLTLWGLGSSEDHSIEARIGYQYSFLEAGLLSRYYPFDPKPQVFGGYLFGIAPEPATVPNPVPQILFFLPDIVEAYPYAGGIVGIDCLDDDDDRSFAGWIAGVLVPIDEHVSLVGEYQMIDFTDGFSDSVGLDNDHIVTIGLRIKFK